LTDAEAPRMKAGLQWDFPLDRSIGRLLHPLDFVRRRMTKGLQVDVGQPEARRGGDVEALVTISTRAGLGDVEVGVICTESYDEQSTDSKGQISRTTSEDVAHEEWLPLENTVGVQTIRLRIPAKAPFSYEGDCLSFKWELVARGRRSGLDAQAAREISVLP
jgi:hypothetical protein